MNMGALLHKDIIGSRVVKPNDSSSDDNNNNNSPNTNATNPQLSQLSTTSSLSQSSIIHNNLKHFISNGDRQCMEQGTGVLSQLNMTSDLTGLVCRDLVNERNVSLARMIKLLLVKRQNKKILGRLILL